ncbi:GIY-YIG nuclease family protein [Arthrobacter oryzae]|uniref:GIY-YIG nuclease family protein n=1 Tax=Arthrobacter oryzae TaxID=409290 RepID=A0A3N0BQT0_9MICC|nr:GIY-YIG nuclease family protein [Arthrobacter oryzae]RNL51413.1 GIY-YIG nuclease family protein [Arthrobacter oryzae]
MDNDISGGLTLGNLFQAAGLTPEDVQVIRHTLKPGGLKTRADAMGPGLLPYVREQGIRNSKLPATPPRIWLNFLATTGRRARFLTAHENRGEVLAERTDLRRYFDLQPSPVFAALADRLVIEWSNDPVNWAKTGDLATGMAVVEIADPASVPFPGFDSLLVSHDELQAVISDDRYMQWRTALSSVQGIYLIADTKTGKLYVGKADGAERFLGRWSEYARNGHGGNVALRELAAADARHRLHFQFSILQVFSPSAPAAHVDAAEAHFKRALLTRQFGMNLN